MRSARVSSTAGLLIWCLASLASPAAAPGSAAALTERTLSIGQLERLELHHVRAESVTHGGRPALRVIQAPPGEASGSPGVHEAIAVIPDSDFGDGEIRTELAGAPRQGAPEGWRGFV